MSLFDPLGLVHRPATRGRRQPLFPPAPTAWTISVPAHDGRTRRALGAGVDGDGRRVGVALTWPSERAALRHVAELEDRARSVGVALPAGYYRVEPAA